MNQFVTCSSWDRDSKENSAWPMRSSRLWRRQLYKQSAATQYGVAMEHSFLKKENAWEQRGFPGGSDRKESARNVGDPTTIPGPGRSPGEGNGNPFQYSCLENSMDRDTWRATVHGVEKSRTGLSDWHFHFHFHFLRAEWSHHLQAPVKIWQNQYKIVK